MTVQQKIQDKLQERGMSQPQSEEVFNYAWQKIKGMFQDYNLTLDSPSADYPEIIYSLIFLNIRPHALNWITENKPEAWFKPAFQ